MQYFYRAKVSRVVDGDTVDFMIDLGFGIYHKTIVNLIYKTIMLPKNVFVKF